jgi:CHRD domain-containing protein
MRKYYSLVGAVLLLGCMDAPANTTAPKLSGAVVTGAVQSARNDNEFNTIETKLVGEEEAPIVPVTNAHGSANVRLAKDGQSMDFVLVVNDITNVTMAHIHVGPRGVAGPIVVWFFPSVTATAPLPGGGGPHSGLLAMGTFTAADLRGPLAGHPLSDLIAAIVSGNAYVNVHTNDGVAPANTGPGDFPGGEVRGQLDRNGH